MIHTILKNYKLLLLAVALGFNACQQPSGNKSEDEIPSLKAAFADKFLIGAALNAAQIEGTDTEARKVVEEHFNSIVAENCMKSEVLQPEQGVYDFKLADQFVAYGLENDMFVIGHTLVWHSQAPPWIFVDDKGEQVGRDTLIARMKSHIYTVVGRYKGQVNGWDVVNEAIEDTASLRESLWFQIIGPDFIELAFQFAHAADPEAELYYNDYNLYKPHKRNEVVKLVKSLQARNLRIDGVGMQAHYGLGMDVTSDIEGSILAFHELGVSTMVTELDVSVLPFPTEQITAEVTQSYKNKPEFNPYVKSLPDSISTNYTNYYKDLFKVYIKHSDKISRITFWGVNDAQTWRNYWPIYGRTDYPLFFDRDNNPKPVVSEIINLAKE